MTNKQFFQEALLEAKAIRETALVAAKEALEEAFTPKIKSMIDAKLSLMEDNMEEVDEAKEMEEAKAKAEEAKKVEEKKDMEEAKDMDEAKADEAKKDVDEAKQEEGYGAYEYEKGKQAGEMAEGELDEMELDEILAELEREDHKDEGVDPAAVPVNPLNLEAKAKAEEAKKMEEKKMDEKKEDVKEGDENEEEVAELTVDELKDLIRDVLADVLGSDAAAEDEVGGEEEITADEEEVSDDMELESILRELDKKEEGKMEEKKDVEEAKKKVDEKKMEEKKDVEEAKKEVEEAKKEVEEAVKVIKALKNELNEVNLLNAKLLYVNKIFKSKSLTESQKVKVINAFDRAESVKEVKNTYETLKESFNGAAQKSTIKESVGFASKSVIGGAAAQPIVADDFVSRMQKLAGIK